MKAVIATWPRRVGVASLALFFALGASFLILISSGKPAGELLGMGNLLKRLVLVPGLVAIMVFAFATVIAAPRAMAASSADKAVPIAGASSSKPFVAQVVGLGWMNPLQRRDYPTEWQ
ncbi:hypothetical protein M3614_22400, partial [Bacillus velezensis]|nr:hypothetical protein [Bacillus velezensis]